MAESRANGQELVTSRYVLLLLALALLCLVLVARAVDLQILHKDFLQLQGDARHLRTMAIPTHRGMIKDRTGQPLAISSPVESLWAHPANLLDSGVDLGELADLLGVDSASLTQRLESRRDREFFYLRRQAAPAVAEQVMALGLPGVAVQREYRRFYPSGEIVGHLLGFTDIDDRGLEGMEYAYESWLRGTPGSKRVLRDRLGRTIADVEQLREPRPGRDLQLSIDRRLQFLAYRELKSAVQNNSARGGSLVLLDTRTGEVLAMVNQPTFNPNNRRQLTGSAHRNRAVVDAWEPGSTIKPFTVAAALEAGVADADTILNTHPGTMRVGRHTITDVRDFGKIDLTTLISKSSNIGAAKLALDLPDETLWNLLAGLGFGRTTGSGYPGESAGVLAAQAPRSSVERATLSFGYGLSATPLQLAQAYAAIASGGELKPVSFVAVDEAVRGTRVMRRETADAVMAMMEAAVETGGTATRAAVDGYRMAGKTGTVRKSTVGGYSSDHYVAWFAGVGPVSDPRLAMVIMLDEPGGQAYYGGQIAAPVFGQVMAGAMRLMNITPDAHTGDTSPALTAMRREEP